MAAGMWEGLLGGAVGAGGDLMGMGLGKLFSLDGGSISSKAADAVNKLQEQALQTDIKYQQDRNRESLTNAAGMTGRAAALDAQRALDENNRPSAAALSGANKIVQQAQSGIGAAQSQANLSRLQGQQQTAGVLDALRSSPTGNAAATIATLGKATQQMGQNQLSSAAGANQAIQQANQGAMAAYSGANDMLDKSRQVQFQTQVQPHLTQVNATNQTANSAIGSGGASVANSASSAGLMTNPLAGMATSLMSSAGAKDAAQQTGVGAELGQEHGDATNKRYNKPVGTVGTPIPPINEAEINAAIPPISPPDLSGLHNDLSGLLPNNTPTPSGTLNVFDNPEMTQPLPLDPALAGQGQQTIQGIYNSGVPLANNQTDSLTGNAVIPYAQQGVLANSLNNPLFYRNRQRKFGGL